MIKILLFLCLNHFDNLFQGSGSTGCASEEFVFAVDGKAAEFAADAQQVVKNAKALAAALLEKGFDLVSGGTDNHLMLADLRPLHITGKELQHRLDENYITVNKNAIPNDPEKPFVTSGVRIGTPAATTRGMVEDDMRLIAQCIYDTASDFEGTQQKVRAAVSTLTQKYPLYE